MFREGWVSINSVPTHVMTWGGWIEDELVGESILVCIPGNPGITDFYFYFLENLYSLIHIPIWIVGHAGTEPAPAGQHQPSIDEHPEFYNLSGQVEHKKAFVKKYVPANKKIFLIGHSVGGKLSVELMKDEEIASRVSQVHLMCPTLQHICQSPNGRLFTSFLQYLIPIIVFLAWVVGMVPKFIQLRLIATYFWMRGDWGTCHKQSCVQGTLKLITAGAARSSLTLAKDEMSTIRDLDSEVYEKYSDKMFCYFAQSDRWAPLCQYNSLMEQHPKVKGTILESKFTHSFVLTAPLEMARILSANITPALAR